MTSSVKERLTGALILIVALVIVVPELFSGRPEQRPATDAPDAQSADAGPPLRSYTMDLEGSHAGQAAKVPEPVAPAAAMPQPAAEKHEAVAAPAPATAANPPPVIPEPTLPATKSPAIKPTEAGKPAAAPPAPPAKPVAAAQSHGWWVQLGSFSARANADRLAATLASAGYSVRVSPTTKDGKELYRVLAGPAEDHAAAVTLQARLSAAGHKGTLVAP